MSEIASNPEQQALKRVEQQQIEAQQEASARVANAQDAAPGMQSAGSIGENAKLRFATLDRAGGPSAEANLNWRAEAQAARDVQSPQSRVRYGPLDDDTNACYDRASDTITLNEKLQHVAEPALIDPLVAHENVHARYKSGDPMDEASLQKYTDEEMEAYRAQRDSWVKVKDGFYQRYPTDSSRAVLGEAGRNLLSAHCQIEAGIQDPEFRQYLEQKYRGQMQRRLAGL